MVYGPVPAKFSKAFDRIHHQISKVAPDMKFTLSQRRHFHLVTQVFKCIHHLSPPYLWPSFQPTKATTTRNSNNRLFVPSIRTNYGKESFYYRGAVEWKG